MVENVLVAFSNVCYCVIFDSLFLGRKLFYFKQMGENFQSL